MTENLPGVSSPLTTAIMYSQIKQLLQQTIFPRFEGLGQESLKSFEGKN